ncbi:EAL domain-containing protein [Rhodobacterales bacterium]|nr:EAL domain-containing protein [Rhodobacterales bacterium]
MAMDFLAPSKPEVKKTSGTTPWKILIVDDDPDVHDVTKIAVNGCSFEGRPFELLHALSVKEAREQLEEHKHVALALVDVVMENDTAGLGLVSWIRNDLGNRFTRVILRTGQPGYAPQADVIMKFDIDGYAEKAELSRTKLITAIVTALRGYKLVMSLESNRRKLETLNEQFSKLVDTNSLGEFSAEVVGFLSELAGRPVHCLVCGLEALPEAGAVGDTSLRVLAATGDFEDKVGVPVDLLKDDGLRNAISRCREEQAYICNGEEGLAMPLITRNGMVGAIYCDLPEAQLVELVGYELLKLFVSNVALGYQKTALLEHIHDLAYVDRVSGLSTYSGFLETFERQLGQDVPLMVVQSDIRRFRVIGDGIGDDKAAAVLKKTGHRLSQTFPDALSIARKEKDEFLILLKGGEGTCVQEVVTRVEEAFQEPISVDDTQITLRLRLGFSPAESSPAEPEQLVRYASIALNDVRQKGHTNHAVFHPMMQEAALERLRLASLLTGGGNKTEFSLHYQPIMRASDESISSFEALMRFHTPAGNQLNTARMIEAAEASGLISEIGAWMFKEAFAEFSHMSGVGEGVHLNVNLSPRQVQTNRIYKDIETAASAANLSLSRLVFEVTEGLFLGNDQTTLSLLTWLRENGAKIVIDDFGTGYSSLSYLRKLPVDGIKIDRSFIMNMDQDADALAVVKSMIAVAKALDLKITAEGVETPAQRKIMQELHCDYLQGYLYSKPLGSKDLQSFIQRSKGSGAAFG